MKGFCLEVEGPYALFTRPELKVERVSYDVITPSAARAIFEAVLWKPAIRWRITRIEVLNPIRWISVRRNEVGKLASPRMTEIFIEEARQQKAGLFLREVKYRLFGEFDLLPPDQQPSTLAAPEKENHPGETPGAETEAKYAAMFRRRASRGQVFHQPYLGTREFSCRFRLVDPEQDPATPIAETRDLGWMLYDLDFSDPQNIRPMFYRPQLQNGVITVPHPQSEEVRK